MAFLHDIAFLLHVAIGGCALIVFWIPVFGRKGSLDHKRFGRYFACAMYAVAVSGMIMSGLDLMSPASGHPPVPGATPQESALQMKNNRTSALFLFSLSILVLATTRHGWLVIKNKEKRQVLRAPVHVMLNLLVMLVALLLLGLGLQERELLFLIFAVLELTVGANQLHYSFKRTLKPRQWWVEHLGGFLGSGIAAYTAFFVFGGSQLLNALMPGSYGDLALLFWVGPGVIGGIAIAVLSRKYTRRFRSPETASM